MGRGDASEGPRPAIRVLVVERHRVFAAALAAVLAADPDLEIVGHLQGLGERLEDIVGMQPDVAVANFALLGPDAGYVTALHAKRPETKVLVLAEALDEATLAACARAGTAGGVAMDASPDDLAGAIKRVHAGEILFTPQILFRLLNQPRRGPDLADPAQLRGVLGPREREVLEAVAAGLSTDETAARLYISTHTVRTHVKNVLSKLGARSRLEAVMVAIRMGLIQGPEQI